MTLRTATLIASLVAVSASTPTPPRLRISAARNVSAEAAVQAPLAFERNDGQHPARFRYVARGIGYRVGFSADGATFTSAGHVMTMRVARGQTTTIRGEQPLAGRVNYFIGRNPRNWRTGVPAFRAIRYSQPSPGVDVVFYGREQALEFDVVVAPGANAGAAAFTFDGAQRIAPNVDGSLSVEFAGRDLRYSRPVAYQSINGTRRPIEAAYRVAGAEVSFDVGAYDRGAELVIDPVMVFATYLGGSASDAVTGVAVDAAGATYVSGLTESTNFPVTAGVEQSGLTGGQDAFVTKLDRDGRMVYSTYLGGSSFATTFGIAVDAAGSAYVFGATDGAGFPVTAGAFQVEFGGGNTDFFISKLNATGSSLVYSTLLGGDNADAGSGAITVDPAGYATIVGASNSDNYPTTTGALSRTHPAGTFTGVATKLNLSGSGLAYSTYLTGTDYQIANGVALDSIGRAVIVGEVMGGMTATPIGANGFADAFVMKLSGNGSSLVFSTRFGGSDYEEARGVAVDPADDSVVVAGTTYSSNFPVGGTTKAPNGVSDAFVLKFSPTGKSPVGVLIGGSSHESATAVALTGDRATVFGDTSSTDFPVLGSTQAFRGSNDLFVVQTDFSKTIFSSLAGGSGYGQETTGGVVDGAGAATVVGSTTGVDAAVFHAVQPANGGGYDGYISRISREPRGTPGPNDVVVHLADVATLHGDWQAVADSSAASGARLHNPDHGAAKLTSALASPADYVEFTIPPLDNGPYRVWLRGRADGNSYSNDSVFVQFSNARNAPDEADNERDIDKIGTTEGMAIVIEDCGNCGVHGWGWQDGGYGKGVLGPPLYFTDGQPTTVRIQRREDGISIDQLVIARDDYGAGPYFVNAPGYQKDDDTILPAHAALGLAGGGDDIVIYAAPGASKLAGSWERVSDTTAAGAVRLHNPNAGAPKLATPLASPPNYFEVTFNARANVPYRLWIRGRADHDDYANDSAYVQFSDSIDGSSQPMWRIGTTSATAYVLEDCSGCGLAGWGWNDNAYGTGALGTPVLFATDGPHTIRVQQREDGLSIDQIVLSPHNYITARPGATKNDTTIVPRD